jgi:proline dehydrogenase
MNVRDRVMFGSHNAQSVDMIKKNITERFPEKRKSIFLATLYGFSDNITYGLREEGFEVKKYVPYGPYNQSMPYLIRRGQESRQVLRE